jgi:hypothetical protein
MKLRIVSWPGENAGDDRGRKDRRPGVAWWESGWKTFATRNESMLSYQMGDYSIAKLWTSCSPLLKARQTLGKNSGQ